MSDGEDRQRMRARATGDVAAEDEDEDAGPYSVWRVSRWGMLGTAVLVAIAFASIRHIAPGPTPDTVAEGDAWPADVAATLAKIRPRHMGLAVSPDGACPSPFARLEDADGAACALGTDRAAAVAAVGNVIDEEFALLVRTVDGTVPAPIGEARKDQLHGFALLVQRQIGLIQMRARMITLLDADELVQLPGQADAAEHVVTTVGEDTTETAADGVAGTDDAAETGASGVAVGEDAADSGASAVAVGEATAAADDVAVGRVSNHDTADL